MPRARSRSSTPTLPGRRRLSSASVSAASAPIVSSPAARRRASERGPTPGSRRTSNGARNDASRPGGTTVSPPGLRRSLAILATTFDVATPDRSAQARRSPDRGLNRLGERARLAEVRRRPRRGRGSPRPCPCARRSARPRGPRSRPPASTPGRRACRGRTKIACGQRRSASAHDIAEWIPNLRAS